MKNLTESKKRLIYAGQSFVLAATMMSMAGCSTTAKTAKAAPKVQLMFVQSAEDVAVDPATKTLRLIKVNQQTLYFADRPVRMAGHCMMADYLDTWRHGEDDFGEDPPNATLSVYEPARKEQVMVVIKITKPVVDGADLLYTYTLIDGVMPATGGATALFIDSLAGRPGVGAGGAGRPGVGAGGAGGPGVGGPRGVGR